MDPLSQYTQGRNRCAELRPGSFGNQYRNIAYWCPGCKERHHIRVRGENVERPSWGFNENFERPTFDPSIHYTPGYCHHHVIDGRIHFCTDCSRHTLGGQVVELPFVDEEGYELSATPSP
jgi:hypothetical protein